MSATVSEVLEAAADLLSEPGAWTTGEWFDTSADDAKAGRFSCMCAEGAIILASGCNPWLVHHEPAHVALTKYLGREIADWNDDPGRTQAEVVEALRAAALQAKGEPQ